MRLLRGPRPLLEPVKRADPALRRKLITQIRRLKESTPCPDCELEGLPAFHPACVMEFDHVTGTKKFNISQALRTVWPDKVPLIWAEIAKCQLRCSNHHRLRTQRRSEQLRRWA